MYIAPRPARLRSSRREILRSKPSIPSKGPSPILVSSLSLLFSRGNHEGVLRVPRQRDILAGRRGPVRGRPQVLGVHGDGLPAPGLDRVDVADTDERRHVDLPLDDVVCPAQDLVAGPEVDLLRPDAQLDPAGGAV